MAQLPSLSIIDVVNPLVSYACLSEAKVGNPISWMPKHLGEGFVFARRFFVVRE